MPVDARHTWERVKKFLFHDLWDVEISSLSALRQLPVRILRVGHLVIRGFREDELPIHASALTFATLMSLVPLLAIIFSFFKGFGASQEVLESKLLEWQSVMPQEFQGFIQQILVVVQKPRFGALGWVGLGFLLFIAIMVLGNIETSFNRIWGIRTARNPVRRVANYIAILVVVPISIGVGSTISLSLRSDAVLSKLGTWAAVYSSLFRLTPFFAAWLAFGFLYVFLPNTRVKAGPALVSSLVGALLWLGWQKFYITMQSGIVARYNAIYGTFASIPIFLAWLYTSWVIVLLGAEVAFAAQNHSTFHLEQKAQHASLRSRGMIGLAVIMRAAEALDSDQTSLDLSTFARDRCVPVRLLNEIVGLFVRAGWLAEVLDQRGSYVLLKSPERIRVREVLNVVLEDGAPPEHLGLHHLGPLVEDVMGKLNDGLAGVLDEQTVKDLLRAQS